MKLEVLLSLSKVEYGCCEHSAESAHHEYRSTGPQADEIDHKLRVLLVFLVGRPVSVRGPATSVAGVGDRKCY